MKVQQVGIILRNIGLLPIAYNTGRRAEVWVCGWVSRWEPHHWRLVGNVSAFGKKTGTRPLGFSMGENGVWCRSLESRALIKFGHYRPSSRGPLPSHVLARTYNVSEPTNRSHLALPPQTPSDSQEPGDRQSTIFSYGRRLFVIFFDKISNSELRGKMS